MSDIDERLSVMDMHIENIWEAVLDLSNQIEDIKGQGVYNTISDLGDKIESITGDASIEDFATLGMIYRKLDEMNRNIVAFNQNMTTMLNIIRNR